MASKSSRVAEAYRKRRQREKPVGRKWEQEEAKVTDDSWRRQACTQSYNDCNLVLKTERRKSCSREHKHTFTNAIRPWRLFNFYQVLDLLIGLTSKKRSVSLCWFQLSDDSLKAHFRFVSKLYIRCTTVKDFVKYTYQFMWKLNENPDAVLTSVKHESTARNS